MNAPICTTSYLRCYRNENEGYYYACIRSPKKTIPQLDDDDDDGSTCSICLDSWEHKGEHRLVSLKCGHLFGDSCIRRYFNYIHSKLKTLK